MPPVPFLLGWQRRRQHWFVDSAFNEPSMLCPRPAESSDSPTIHPKQAKMEKAAAREPPENGECLVAGRGSKEFQIAAAEAVAAATPTGKSSSCKDPKQQGGQAALQEEDPERMKHSKSRAQGYSASCTQRWGVVHRCRANVSSPLVQHQWTVTPVNPRKIILQG